MMSLNKLVAVAFMVVAASSQVEAQGGGGGGGGGRGGAGGMGGAQAAERMKGLLFKDITLDAAQTKAVDSIMTASAAKTAELRASMQAGGDRQAMMAQTQAIQTEQRTALRGVLKPDQQAQFDKNVEEMPAPGAGRRPPSMSFDYKSI